MIAPIRAKLEAVIAEYREWAKIYQIDEDITDVFEMLIQDGDLLNWARDNIRAYKAEWEEQDSPGIFDMAMAHASYIAKAYRRLQRAELAQLRGHRLMTQQP